MELTLDRVPASWNADGMDWNNPDPSDSRYYLALIGAMWERTIALKGLPSSRNSYADALAYFSSCNFLDGNLAMSHILTLLYSIPRFLDRDAFFKKGSIELMQQDYWRGSPQLSKCPIKSDMLSTYLRGLRDYLNTLTLFSGNNYYYGTSPIGGYGEMDNAEPSYYPGTPPPYDFTPFSELYEESYSVYASEYGTSIAEVMSSVQETGNSITFGGFDYLGTPNGYYVSFDYYLRRENNFPWAHSAMYITRYGVVVYAKSNAPFQPTVHCLVRSTDDSYLHISETGIISQRVDSVGGLAPGMSDEYVLLSDYIVGLQGVHIIESKPPESYPISDVEVPFAGTKGWQIYECGGVDDAYFVLDFNCEGGFKFRPDSE